MTDLHHAKLSPSGAHRWMACPGSLHLESRYPDSSSEFSEEGTLAHDLAARCLADEFDAKAFVGGEYAYLDHGEHKVATITNEMAREVQKYVDNVRQLADGGGELLVEQRLPIFTTLDPIMISKRNEAGELLVDEEGLPLTEEVKTHGTSDTVVIREAERLLIINDLKYGRGVQVWAEQNEQLMLYALGALDEFGLLYDFDRVQIGISQPRLDHFDSWECTVDELREFEQRALQAGKVALSIVSLPEGHTAMLNPGDKQCKFCKAKGDCAALRDQVLATVAGEFDVLDGSAQAEADLIETVLPPVIDTLKKGEIAVSITEAEKVLAAAYGVAPKAVDFMDPSETTAGAPVFIVKKPTLRPALEQAAEQLGALGDDHLAICMDSVDLVENWCKAVRAEAERRMLAGTPVPGWKLVTGKQGNRAWTDEEEARKALKSMRLRDDVMYDWTLISPTTAEKLHAEGVIKPKQWARVQELICRSNGKPSVAPAADKRSALIIGKVEDEFSALDDDGADIL